MLHNVMSFVLGYGVRDVWGPVGSITKAQDWYSSMITRVPRPLVTGDIIYFDASRVSCKEALVVHLGSYGKLSSAPIQIMEDSSAYLDPAESMARVAERMPSAAIADVSEETSLVHVGDDPDADAGTAGKGRGRAKGRGRGKSQGRGRLAKGRGRGRRPGGAAAGDSTKWYMIALANALLMMLPFEDLRPWLPSPLRDPDPAKHPKVSLLSLGADLVADDQTRLRYLWEGPDGGGRSTWALAPELLGTEGGARVLVLVADEGSQGWSLFQFLASYGKMRVLFMRDPNHRMSNAFNAALRGVPAVMQSVLDVITVHKWRRAPYGGGRFWGEAKEALSVLIDSADLNHELLLSFAASIANDHGQPPQLVTADPAQVKVLLRVMLNMPMQARVEMRRWFTYHTAGWTLDQIWHSLLLAMITLFCIEGKDPWQAIADAPPSRPAPGQDTPERKNFRYKVCVLRTLYQSINQRILRSTLVASRRLYNHHCGYERDSSDPGVSFNYTLVWSSWSYWIGKYIIPTMNDCFFVAKWAEYIGLPECQSTEAPLYGEPEADPLNPEAARLLFLHARQSFSFIREMLMMVFLWASAGPWSFCRLLHPLEAERRRQMDVMQSTWELFLRLRSSELSLHREFLRTLTFFCWMVWQEPMMLFEKANWDCTNPAGLSYVAAMFGFLYKMCSAVNPGEGLMKP